MLVTNKSDGLQGVRTKNGVRYIKPGEAREITFADDAAEAHARRLPFLAFAEIAAEPALPTVEAVHRGKGRYFVMDGDKPLSDAMTKEDAEAFNGLSDEDKAAFLKKA